LCRPISTLREYANGIMLKSRNSTKDIVSEDAPLPAQGRLLAAVGKYKRRYMASAMLVVVLSAVLFGIALTDGPDRVVLGVGKAGIMDTLAASDTSNRSATDTAPAPADGPSIRSSEEVDSELPQGDASYYGNELAGNPTASGESFDPKRLTAAHRTLPFGTRLRVTSIRDGRSVIVRVNDRGPFSKERVLDLSYAAARQIGLLERGEARVRMEVLK